MLIFFIAGLQIRQDGSASLRGTKQSRLQHFSGLLRHFAPTDDVSRFRSVGQGMPCSYNPASYAVIVISGCLAARYPHC